MRNEWRQDLPPEKMSAWHCSSSLEEPKPWTHIPVLPHLSHGVLSSPAQRTSRPGTKAARGTWARPGMAGRSQLRGSDPKVEVPMGDNLSSWRVKAWGQCGGTLEDMVAPWRCGGTLKVWWHLHLEIFSSAFLLNQQIFSCLNPARIHPTLGPAHMSPAADHILLSVSPSWHAQPREQPTPFPEGLNSTTIPNNSGKSWGRICANLPQSWKARAGLMMPD